MKRPMVTVLALGGTIAMTESARGGVVPTLTGEMLVEAVPAVAEMAEIGARSFRQSPGVHLQYADIEALAEAVEREIVQGAQGVVITQGTDTIEETAFALDRLLDVKAPVVVTGAMRNPTVPGADGAANLLAAVRVAISDEARGLGCVVVLNDEIHAARFVRKAHTSSPAAFLSAPMGPLGWIVEGEVRIAVRPDRIESLQRDHEATEVPVALITVTLGDDGGLVEAVRRAGFGGMVVEGAGGGHVPPDVADALERAAEEMPVVLASRTGGGEVLRGTYGYPGGEIDLQRRGIIRGGWLDGLKAKVLLTLLLRRGQADREVIAAAFGSWGGGTTA